MSTLSPEEVKLDTEEAKKTNSTPDDAPDNKDKEQDNPYIENRKTGGVHLKLRTEHEYVPRPFKSINQVIIVSYVCYVFLIFPGAIANNYAWEARKFWELGAYSEAKSMARAAVRWIYVGFAIGGVCALILCIVLPLTI